MAATPIFTATPKIGMAAISTANTNRDGTGTLGTVITGATNGTKVFEVVICASGTVTAGVVRLFIDNGTNTRLIEEILITATTPGTTTAVARYVRTFNNLVLPNAYVLKASTHNAEGFNVIAYAGDF